MLQLPEQHEAVEKEIRAHQTVQHRNVLRLVDHEIRDLRRGGGTGLLLFPYYQVCAHAEAYFICEGVFYTPSLNHGLKFLLNVRGPKA